MTRTNGKRGGFTLLELMVVVAMIVLILGAMTTSVGAARARARTQKALGEVKVISQAILAYENYSRGGKFELPVMTDADAGADSLGFLLGRNGASADSGAIPVLLQAALSGGGKMLDPWGTPYKVSIRAGNANLTLRTVNSSLKTGYYLPNFYRTEGN